jgi:DNA-binding response OmpR family regulator
MFPGLLRESLPERSILPGGVHLSTWPSLLVVDSDVAMIETLVCFFEKRGFHVAACQSLAEAKDFFYRCKTWTLVIADYHLPDGNGAELCSWIQEQSQNTPFLLTSGSPHFSAFSTDIDFLAKPFPLEKLETYVRTIMRRG